MNKKIISSLEFGRVLAIFAVLALHAGLFNSYPLYNDEPWVGNIFNQLTRFGVPLFFLLAGYFVKPKLASHPLSGLTSYAKPLLRVWVVWSIICLILPFRGDVLLEHGYLAERQGFFNYLSQSLANTLVQGGLDYLWFLPALVMAVAIIALLDHFKQARLLLPVAIALYLYGVLAGSYVVLTDLPSPFFTRNGPFFSTLLVSLGYLIRQNSFMVKPSTAFIMMVIGLLAHMSEAYFLFTHGAAFNVNDYLFGTALWATGLFLLLLNYPDFGNNRVIHYLGRRVLAIYVVHMIFLIYMMNIEVLIGAKYAMRDLLQFGGTTLTTLLFIALIERTPLKKWLFR
ncbi:acyltransferase [Vibrio sonorensis]|uniref:acyltransferase n=1 Tax=Vibrio sonorensis TaxID=1004316 RepID=UPI0008D9B759|nr:acyltransferase family protein [Vibrio sonorensis]